MTGSVVAPEHVDNVVTDEAVSGWSIFWAMVAIASHAMLQVSFSGSLWNRDGLQGSLWPHRSSPFICLIDGVADTYLGLQSLRRRCDSSDGEQESHSGRNGALTKLALFSLGVLPQAIKLFCMRGIPLTQVIAAMYLLPSAIGLVRSLSSSSPEEDIQEFLGSLEGSANLPQTLQGIVYWCGWIPNLIGIYVLWYGLADRIGFSASDDVVNAVTWLRMICFFTTIIYFFQIAGCFLFRKESSIRRYPVILMLFFTNMCSIPHLVGAPGKRLQDGVTGRWDIALDLFLSLCIASYLCAMLLDYLVGWIYNQCHHCGQRHWLLAKCRSRATDPNEVPVQEQTTGLETSTPVNGTDMPHQVLHGIDSGDATGDTAGAEQSPRAATDLTAAEAVRDVISQATGSSRQQGVWKQVQEGCLMAFAYVICLAIIPVIITYDWLQDEEGDHDTQQQSTAEEGSIGASPDDRNREGRSLDAEPFSFPAAHDVVRIVRQGIRILGKVLIPLIRLIGRLWLGMMIPYVYTWKWIRWQVIKRRPLKILENAFGLLNFSMAVLYYLVFFDGRGTSAPAWSEMFG